MTQKQLIILLNAIQNAPSYTDFTRPKRQPFSPKRRWRVPLIPSDISGTHRLACGKNPRRLLTTFR
jgi:hypothetical protein